MRRLAGIAVAVLGVAAGATACEPAPPRLQLVVTTVANGRDDSPGDGRCSSAAAAGGCTLQAAIGEAGTALAGADIVVPAGRYGGFDARVAGDVRINPSGDPGVTIVGATFTVAAVGRLELVGVNASTSTGSTDFLHLAVSGSTSVTRSVLGRVDVAAGGGMVLYDSIVTAESRPSISNAGRVVAIRSSFLRINWQDVVGDAVLDTPTGGASFVGASVLAGPYVTYNGGYPLPYADVAGTCSGVPLTSLGHTHVEVPCGSPTAEGDRDGGAALGYRLQIAPYTYETSLEVVIGSGSPLVDAIPLGHPLCDPTDVDVYGRPRGVDGDGDGIGGCDVGAVERQP